MTQSTETIRNRVESIKVRIAKAAAERADAVEKIKRAAVDGAPINGALRERDEADARVDALTRERERLETEELPIAQAAEARASRAKALAAARDAHARHSKLARKFDDHIARANAALAELMAAEQGYRAAMGAAGLGTGVINWPLRLSLAIWAAKSPGGAGRVWNPWRGQADLARPALAIALGLGTGPKTHVATLEDQLARHAPPPDDAKKQAAPPPERGASIDPPARSEQVDPLELPEAAPDPLALPGDAGAARARRKAEYAAAEGTKR